MKLVFTASVLLGPLAMIAWLATPSSPLWLNVVSGGIALAIGWIMLAAQWVRVLARLLRVVLGLLAIALLAAATIVMHDMVSWPWLVWPTLVAGVVVLCASALASFDPTALRRQAS